MTGDITIGKHNEIKPFNAEKMFKDLVAYGVGTCGVNTAPDAITMGNLNEYVFSQLKNYTFEEVKRAIYFNASGEFPEKIKPYNLFDVIFLSDVMTQWLILKTQTRNRITALLPKPKEAEPETPQTLYQGLLNYINKNQEFPFSWAWEAVFNHMDKEGLIKDTEEEKRTIWKAVKTEFESKLELELMDVKDFIERGKMRDELPERVANEYRKRRIIKNLQYLITPN